MTHRQGVVLMIACTLMWSLSGIVTRQLESARGFEIAFWRSLFTSLALIPLLVWPHSPRVLWARIRAGRTALWSSAACWAVMFTAFMLALSMTTVANVLVTLALTPLLTALIARLAIGHRLAPHTLAAITLAAAGLAWMYGTELADAGPRELAGIAIAASVPLCAAVNWTLLQHAARRGFAPGADMMPSVLLGAIGATLFSLPAALPLAASSTDIAWLALLGVVQLAIPCLLAVRVTQVLSAPEISLYGLLEVVFGVSWVWLAGGESPSPAVLGGGGLVLLALVMNEVLGARRARIFTHQRGP